MSLKQRAHTHIFIRANRKTNDYILFQMKLVSIKICTQFVVWHWYWKWTCIQRWWYAICIRQKPCSETHKHTEKNTTRGAWCNKSFTIRFEIWFIKYLWIYSYKKRRRVCNVATSTYTHTPQHTCCPCIAVFITTTWIQRSRCKHYISAQ